MTDTVTNVIYSQGGNLYAGMQQENIRAQVNSADFKTEKKREKAYNKQIKIFNYADVLVDGKKDGVISEDEILAYDKNEKTKKTWKTIGLVVLGIGLTIGSTLLVRKIISNSKAISNTMKAATTAISKDGCVIKQNVDLNKECNLISEIARSHLPKEMSPRELTGGRTQFGGYGEFGELISKTESESVIYSPLFIGQFGESGNVVVNNYLRTGKNTSQRWSINKIKDVIDSAHNTMNKVKLQHDTILYRGVRDFDYIPEVGGILKDKGFVSTSANSVFAQLYGKKMIKIIAPKDTKCMPCAEYLEILLDAGSEFRILSKNDYLVEMLLL